MMMLRRALSTCLLVVVFTATLAGCTPSPEHKETEKPAPTISVTAVTLDNDKITLEGIGTILQLTATVSPSDATNQSVTWKSLDPTVATVDQGYIKSVAPGSTVIEVHTVEGNKVAQCEVLVKTATATGPVPETPTSPATPPTTPAQPAEPAPTKVVPAAITLDVTSLTFTTVDAPIMIEATVTPEDAEDKTLTWTSTNPKVATVDQSGKVTAVAKGTAAIRATTVAGGHSAECAVTIAPVVPQGLALDRDALALTLGFTPVTLTATVLPAAAENKAVQWSSSKPDIATVDSAGKVTAVAEGTAVVTAKTVAGNVSVDCEVTVTKLILAPIAPIVIGLVKVTGISIDRTRLDLVTGGSPFDIVASIEPVGALNKKITWVSSNTAIATVNSSGRVTPVAKGKAVITATTDDGGFKANCPVEVGIPNTEGTTPGNLATGGQLTAQGNWIYYSGQVGGGRGLYKSLTDGTMRTLLSNDWGSYINVVGDWIYYTSDWALYKIKTDGSERTLINNIDTVTNVQVIAQWIYYLSNGSMYRIHINGTNRTKLNDEPYASSMLVDDNNGLFIYYSGTPTTSTFNGSKGIYRIGVDGRWKSTITSDWIKAFTISGKLSDTHIYYMQVSSTSPDNLYSVELNGRSKKKLASGTYSSLNVSGAYIYYSDISDTVYRTTGMHRMQIDGTLPMKISSKRIGYGIYVIGNYIYFRGFVGETGSFYKVRNDGIGELKLH